MSRNKPPLKNLKQNALQRRLSVSLAGAKSGARLLGVRAKSVFLDERQKQQARSQALAEEAEKFTKTLGELKGAYVKIGQMMALYGDHLLPKEVSKALHNLEDQTEAMSWQAIAPVIKSALGDDLEKLEIEPQAFAAASLSQVHRAVLKSDQQQVCLKVQYPGIAKTIDADFALVLNMLKMARWVSSARDLEAWMSEIKSLLHAEVDYQREAAMINRVKGLLADDQRYTLPTVFPKFTTKNILTMSMERGCDVTSAEVAQLSLRRRNALAKSMLELFFKEVFDWGLMQTDPNFGNYKVRLKSGDEKNDKIVLLDFGAVQSLSREFQQALKQTISGAFYQNREQLIEGAIALRCLKPNQSEEVQNSFVDFCVLLMEPFRKPEQIPDFALNNRNQYLWQQSKLLRRVGKLGAQSMIIEGFQSPPGEFALIARKLAGVFTFITTLKAEFNAQSIIKPYLAS